MRSYAEARDWIVLEEFVEAGASARTTDRLVLHRLFQRSRNAEATKMDVVLVHKIDSTRQERGGPRAIRAQLRDFHVALASMTESLEESVAGRLVEHILASMAKFYAANLSEGVKKRMRQKVEQADSPHLPPRGYHLIPRATGVGRAVALDPSSPLSCVTGADHARIRCCDLLGSLLLPRYFPWRLLAS